MKKYLAIIISLTFISANLFAQFDFTSFRIDGINTELAQIVNDEYSDWRHNPADILAITGHRFYTIATNLDGKGDTLNGGANDSFQFGYVGNPLKSMLPITGQFGLLIHQSSDISASLFAPGGLGSVGDTKASFSDVTVVDVDGDQTYDSNTDTTVTRTATGERYIETNEDVDSIDYGQKITDNLKLGISVERALDTCEEPIKASWNYTSTTVGSTATDTEDNTLNAKEELTTNDMTLMIGGRLALSEKWNVGGIIGMTPHASEQKRTSTVSINRDMTAGTNPTTFTATGTDINSIEAATGNITAMIYATNDTMTSLRDTGTGFAWSDGKTLRELAMLPANAVGKAEEDGTATAVEVNTYYNLTDTLKLYGAVGMVNKPYDLKLNASDNVSAIWYDAAGIDAADEHEVTLTDLYSGTGTNEGTDMKITLGAEQDLPGNVKIGYGIIFGKEDEDIEVTYSRSYDRLSTNDNDGDGLNVAQADPGTDSRVRVTSSDKWKEQWETGTLLYQFPVGCELQPFKNLKLRLGATHEVRKTTTKTVSKVVEDGVTRTVTEVAGLATNTAYSNTKTTGDVAVQSETETKTRTTTYYYGAGYQWSENLSFDILGFADDTSDPTTGTGGAGLLELSNWRISATLMFGGADDYSEGL